MSYDQLKQLIKELYSSRDGRKAAEELRQQGEPGGQVSAEVFIKISVNDSTPLRRAAAQILREWREYVPIEPLFLAMQDANEQVRSAIEWVIADVGAYAHQESLLPHLADTDVAVRASVLSALGKRAPIASVLDAICSPDEDLREAGISLVGSLGEQMPVELLVSLLQSEDAHIRFAAVSAMGMLRSRTPIEPLIEALQDVATDVRLQAIEALANMGERVPQVELHELLDDADKWIREVVVKALARVGDPAALAIIVDSLHTDHEWARETALIRLSESTDVARRELARHLPIEELLHLLEDEWYPVGHLSARLIAELGEAAPFAELLALVSHPLPQARRAALRALALLGDHIPLSQYISVEPVLAALDAEDVETRRGAAVVLDCCGPLVSVDRLLPLIEDDDVQVARIVAMRGYPEGINALVAGLRTMYHARNAAATLGELGEDAPIEPLLTALAASDSEVCRAAAEALYKTHPDLLPQLVPELVETLCYGKVGPLLEPLQQVLLAQALARLHSTQPTLLRWLDQALDLSHWEARMWAALAWSQMKPGVANAPLEKLLRLLDDPESAGVRDVARRALDVLIPQQGA